MKIALVHKYYYPRGGDAKYTIELAKYLELQGHQVHIFSMHYPENLDHPDSKYWLSWTDYENKSLKNLKEVVLRPIFSSEVKNKFLKFLHSIKPDVVHFNGIHSQISPLVVELANQNGIPTIWTLHDYKLLCPAYTMYREKKVCESCLSDQFSVIRHKCIKNSLLGSIIGFAEIKTWNLRRLQQLTNMFISPSSFLKNKLVENGLNENKIKVLPNFFSGKENKVELKLKKDRKPQVVYFGRLSSEKGLEMAIESILEGTELKIKIIGTGPEEVRLKSVFDSKRVDFLGYLPWEDIQNIVAESLFSLLPSEWYENNPLSGIESLMLGTPVIGSNIGGIPEIVRDGQTGFLYEMGSKEGLIQSIIHLTSLSQPDYDALIDNCILYAKENFSIEGHYKALVKIYNQFT